MSDLIQMIDECSAVVVNGQVIGIDAGGLRVSALNRHGVGLRNGRRALSMGCVKPANDDEEFYRLKAEREGGLQAIDRLILQAMR